VFSLVLGTERGIGLLLLFFVAAVGLVVGWRSPQGVPLWFVVGLTPAGIAMVLVGLSVEDVVGPSGAQYTPLHTAGSFVLLFAAFVAGIALGGAIRPFVGPSLARALSSRPERVSPTTSAAVAFAVLAAIALAVHFSSMPLGPDGELVLVVLAPAAAGALIGWVTRAAVPVWLLVVLPAVAIVCHVLGGAQYNDDGDPGPLFGLVVLVPGLLAAGSLIAGVTAGASRRPAGPDRDRPLDSPQRL
jgi:hypothetical protein